QPTPRPARAGNRPRARHEPATDPAPGTRQHPTPRLWHEGGIPPSAPPRILSGTKGVCAVRISTRALAATALLAGLAALTGCAPTAPAGYRRPSSSTAPPTRRR